MKFEYIKDEKNEAEIEIDNLTIAEILRVYLDNDDAVSFVAWKKEHPSKNPILTIKSKGKTVKKALQDAVSQIDKDSNSVVSKFKKAK